MVGKHAKAGPLAGHSSPKVRLILSQSSTPSSCASFRYEVPFPTYKGVKLDPIPPIAVRSDSHPIVFIHQPPDGGNESPASRDQPSATDSGKPASDLELTQSA